MKSLALITVFVTAVVCRTSGDTISASDAFREIYEECLSRYSYSCVKPKMLSWMSKVSGDDEIKISNSLSLVRKPGVYYADESKQIKDKRFQLLDTLDEFLATHTLRIRIPDEIIGGEISDLVPRSLVQGLPQELSIPLTDNTPSEGRGFVKKVLVPFFLGLKFKVAVLVPLAFALIALKTWKALTLGLISLVLSGAMVIFKFTKPKVVNYEVIHYPQHHAEHHVQPGWEPHGHGPYQRSIDDPQELAYQGQI